MNWEELKPTLVVLGPVFGVIGTMAGLAGRLLWMYIGRLHGEIEEQKTDIARLKPSAERTERAENRVAQMERERDDAIRGQSDAESKRIVAERDREEAIRKLGEAENERDKARVERNGVAQERTNAEIAHEQALRDRDQARIERDGERERLKKAAETAMNNYKAWEKEKEKRLKVQQRAETAEMRLAELETALPAEQLRVQELTVVLQGTEKQLAATDAARLNAEKERDKAQQKAERNSNKLKELQSQLNGIIKQDGRVWRKPVPDDAPRFLPLTDRKKPVVISVMNLKGGVGKTTITANIAGYLSETLGKQILLIDADHQRSLSQLILSTHDRMTAALEGHTLQHFLTSPTRDGSALLATTHSIPGLDNCRIITNTDALPEHGIDQSLDDLEMLLMGHWLVDASSADARFLMRRAIQSDQIRSNFDHVMIDCPPRLTTACISALAASDFVLIPVQAEAVTIRSVHHLLKRVRELREAKVLPNLRVLGMVANMVSSKATDKASHEAKLLVNVSAAAQHLWGQSVPVFETKLTREVRYAEASRELDDQRPLRLAIGFPSIHRQYQDLMKNIEERINESLGVAEVSK